MSEYKFPDELDDDKNVELEVSTDNEVEIEIVDDTPEKDRGRKPLDREVADPTDDEIESYSDGVKKRIKELTHARHDERRVKEATMREKQELETFTKRLLDENQQLKGFVNNGSQQYAGVVQNAAEAELEKARRQYKDAQEAYDTDAILVAQEALMDAKSRLEQAKNFRPAPLQTYSDEVQTYQAAPKPVQPDDKTLRWQAKNQWFGQDGYEELTSYSLGLHQKLVNSGVDPRSDEYFEQIDARIKSKFPEVFGGADDRSRSGEGSKRPASIVAPATRSTGRKTVQLSTSAMALAKKFGLTPQQYAAQVAKLENSNG